MGLTNKKLRGINPAVLVCNGPSLKDVPVEWLNSHITLVSNSFYLKEGFLSPDYWFLEGRGHLKTQEERIARARYMHLPKSVLINSEYADAEEFARFRDKITPITYYRDSYKIRTFQPHPLVMGHGTANSVTYAMFQYAFSFGFDPLLVVGMDMKFSSSGKWHFYDGKDAPEFEEMNKSRFERWKVIADASYRECAKYFAFYNRRIINLTPNTGTDAFETEDFAKWE